MVPLLPSPLLLLVTPVLACMLLSAEEDTYNSSPEPDYAPETRFDGQERLQEYYYGPAIDPYVAEGADRPVQHRPTIDPYVTKGIERPVWSRPTIKPNVAEGANRPVQNRPAIDPNVADRSIRYRTQSKQRGQQLKATTSASKELLVDFITPPTKHVRSAGNADAADEAREYMRKETEQRQLEEQFQRTLVDELLRENPGDGSEGTGGQYRDIGEPINREPHSADYKPGQYAYGQYDDSAYCWQ
jgi:hypothetical protein